MQVVDHATVRCALTETPESIIAGLSSLPETISFIQVEHRRYGGENANLIRVCAAHRELRPVLECLARHGWFVYKSDGATSALVRHDHIPRLWHQITDGTYTTDRFGTVHSISETNVVDRASSLVVVFSSMSLPFDGAGLSRYFEQNFASIERHLGAGTVVLRIADLDAVVGGFYAPTRFAPDRLARVQGLIDEVANRYHVDSHRVVLYGGSKGGTGALLHALVTRSAWKCVAVDPVVDDDYYERTYADSHWTGGELFVSRKVDLFAEAAAGYRRTGTDAAIGIVTSQRSPLYAPIRSLADRIAEADRLLCLSSDPRIADHTDVSARTLRFVTGLINVWTAGVAIPGGVVEFD